MNKSNVIFFAILMLFFAVSIALAHEDAKGYHNYPCYPDRPAIVNGKNNEESYHSESCRAGDTTKCIPNYLARKSRNWLDVGDPADPYLDPLLMKHSFYADSSLNSRNGWTFPGSGYSGTAGVVWQTPIKVVNKNSCEDAPESFIQTLYYGATAEVAAGNSLQWGNITCHSSYGCGTAPWGQGTITQAPVVYPVKPRFPDIRRDSFFHDSARVLVVPSSGITLGKGVHYYEKIEMCNGVLNITVGKKGEKTIIYLKGYESFQATCDGNILIQAVDEDGNPVPQPVNCESPEHGQAMIIARGCIVKTNGDQGQFYIDVPIITLGQFMIRGNSRFSGQVIGDMLTTSGHATASAAIANMTFDPVRTYQLDVPPVTFGENKFWAYRTSGCDFEGDETKSSPKYYDAITYGYPSIGATETSKQFTGYYDTTIAVSLADAITEGSIEVKWKIKSRAGAVEQKRDDVSQSGRILVEGDMDGDYITGNIIFTPTMKREDIRLFVFDNDNRPDTTIKIEFEKVSVSEGNFLSPNLMPTIITIKSDDDCSVSPPEPEVPEIKWAAIYGDHTGYPITIKAEIENIDELDGTEEYWFKWGATSKTQIPANAISTNGSIVTFDITSFASQDGADDNGLFYLNDASKELKDSCGPAIKLGTANFYAGENGQLDTIEVQFTEKIEIFEICGFAGCDGYSPLLAFAQDEEGNGKTEPLQPEFISVNEDAGIYSFLYNRPGGIVDENGNLDVSHVKIVYYMPPPMADHSGGIFDASPANNPPLEDNQWVEIINNTKLSPLPEIISAELFDTWGMQDGRLDGIGDSLMIKLELSKADEIYTTADIETVEITWDGNTKKITKSLSELKNIGDDYFALVDANIPLTHKNHDTEICIIFYDKETCTRTFGDGGVIKDKVAPVITKVLSYKRFDKPNTPDTLKVKFSEEISDAGVSPILVDNNRTYSLSFVPNSIGEDSTAIYAVTNGHFEKGDSIWLKTNSGVIDLTYDDAQLPNEQTNENNQRIEIEDYTHFHFVLLNLDNAAYFDTDATKDGYIDLLKIEYELNSALEIPENEIRKIAEKIELPQNRAFNPITANSISVNENMIEIKVSQDKNIAAPKTYVDADDKISLNYSVKIPGNIEISANSEISIADSIAPVIIKGRFEPMTIENENDKIFDTLKLWFSEPLKNFVRKDALGLKSGKKFEFNNAAINDSYIAIPVEYNEALSYLPVNGQDSIRIEGGFEITDAKGIMQEVNTVFVPLEVGKYNQDYEILIYPNPYSLSFDDKISILVRPIKSRGDKKVLSLSGKVTILDAIGNSIINPEKFNADGKNLIWSWKGKNSRKRDVGIGTYQAIIEIINDADNDKKIYLKQIGIKN